MKKPTKQVKKSKFAYTEDGQHYYIDDRPVSLEEYMLKQPKQVKKIPYFAIGNDELDLKPKAGKTVVCKNCGKVHKIEFGTVNGKINKRLGFTKCGEKLFMVTLEGKLL